jgi:hypothetical protein
MPKAAKVLISFIDGSYLYALLSKKLEPDDALLMCHSIIGLPEGSPADKPTIAASIVRQTKAGAPVEFVIPMSRINGISVIEEYLGKDVPSDMQDLWK